MSVLAVGSGWEAGRDHPANGGATGSRTGSRDYPIPWRDRRARRWPPSGSRRELPNGGGKEVLIQFSRSVVRAFSTECSMRSSVVPKSASRLSTYWSTSARMRAASACAWAPSSSARVTAPR